MSAYFRGAAVGSTLIALLDGMSVTAGEKTRIHDVYFAYYNVSQQTQNLHGLERRDGTW